MGIYLPNMEMPTCCEDCPLENFDENYYGDESNYRCPLIYKGYTSNNRYEKRRDDCPLVEVPPHGRLIDADALEDRCSRQAKDEWNKSTGTNWGYAYATFESDVEDAPTIIPAEEGD